MITLLMFTLLGAQRISVQPTRILTPTPKLVCPAGYSIWWPEGKESENDKYPNALSLSQDLNLNAQP